MAKVEGGGGRIARCWREKKKEAKKSQDKFAKFLGDPMKKKKHVFLGLKKKKGQELLLADHKFFLTKF